MLGDVFIDNFLNIAKKSFDGYMFPSLKCMSLDPQLKKII